MNCIGGTDDADRRTAGILPARMPKVLRTWRLDLVGCWKCGSRADSAAAPSRAAPWRPCRNGQTACVRSPPGCAKNLAVEVSRSNGDFGPASTGRLPLKRLHPPLTDRLRL